MKSTEQILGKGSYASRQSHPLNEHDKVVPEKKRNLVIYEKAAVEGHAQQPTLDSVPSKWNARSVGDTATQNRTRDWLLSAANYHPALEPVTRLSPAMSIKATKAVDQTKLTAEHVSTPQKIHSRDAKASAFLPANSPISNGRHTAEPKHIPPTDLPHKLKQSIDANRLNKQINKSFNGNERLITENDESLHKSITNQSILVNAPALKLSETGKRRMSTFTERKHKQKADGRCLSEKKKNAKNGGGRKGAVNQMHPDSSLRLPSKPHENGAFSASDSDKSANKRIQKEWHSPESYIYDDINTDAMTEQSDSSSCMQTFWFRDSPNENLLTREQRLENKRDNLRRQAFQYAQAQHFRSTALAKRRLITVTKALAKFKNERNNASPTKCSVQSCSNVALAMTAYCYLHITLNKDQKLFHPCTAKFSDNSQCRVPVFDISHELPLCREHAWKRDNYNRISQEQKPKKMLKNQTKSHESDRQPKRNKKKKRRSQLVPNEPLQTVQKHQLKAVGQLSVAKQGVQPAINVVWNPVELFKKADKTQLGHSRAPTFAHTVNKYLPDNVMVYQLNSSHAPKIKVQNIISVGENSSAYESSEDTGVGELSESELMTAQDGIEIPLSDTRLLEEHDLTNVLNQIPVDAFNDLIFQAQQHDQYEPSQKEQDELARALEEVDEQVKSLEQMTNSSDFLDNFEEILVDGSEVLCDEVLTTSSVKNDIRGLVHT